MDSDASAGVAGVMIKILKWTGKVGSLVVLVAVIVLAGGRRSRGWSFGACPRSGWHLETGYLLDDSGFRLGPDAGWEEPGPYLSGRWYRFGPVAVQRRWGSRVAVTNLAVQTKIRRAF